LAWLRLEPPDPEKMTELRLDLWADGARDKVRLATVDPHGRSARWRPKPAD